MFKRVINAKGFWKSVLWLAMAFAVVFGFIKWAIEGFSKAYFTEKNPIMFFITLLLAGFVYGFFVTFGKFSAKLKENTPKK